MPKNTTGGKRFKRNKHTQEDGNQPVPIAVEALQQQYAIATKALGNRKFTANCSDGNERLVIIPGKFKGRRNWVNVGTVLLLNIRDYQDIKADVIYVYKSTEAKKLFKMGELAQLADKESSFGEENVMDIGDFDENENDSDESIDLEDL